MHLKLIIVSLLACLALTGCLPRFHSIGVDPMSQPLDHRLDGDDVSNQKSISISGFVKSGEESDAIKDLKDAGINLNYTMRGSGGASNIFLSASVGFLAGTTNFCCRGSDPYTGEVPPPRYATSEDFSSIGYNNWLWTESGSKRYFFWDLQERVMVGVDFSPGIFLYGIALGVQAYEGSSEYDDMRESLKKAGYVVSEDGDAGLSLVSACWLGVRLGPKGRWGYVVGELGFNHKGELENWTSVGSLNYRHPSGYFAGIGVTDFGNYVTLGKTFVF